MIEKWVARWYEAVGGDGLQVRRADDPDTDDNWRIFGLVTKQKRGGWYDAIRDRQEESYSMGLFQTREKAKDYLLSRSGAELVGGA